MSTVPAQGTHIILPIAGLHAIDIPGFGTVYINASALASGITISVAANDGTNTTGGSVTLAPAVP